MSGFSLNFYFYLVSPFFVLTILSQAAKQNVNERDFIDSLLPLGFTPEHSKIFLEYYELQKIELRDLLESSGFNYKDKFVDISWRLDIQLSSRSSQSLLNPIFYLKLTTKSSNNNNNNDNNNNKDEKSNNTTEESVQMLQTDYANLKHLTEELQNALDTTKLTYSRRIGRHF